MASTDIPASFGEQGPGETTKRLLDMGTRLFICGTYPKNGPSKDCVIRPVNPVLGGAVTGCACGSAGGALFLPALALLLRRRTGRSG